MCCRYCRESFPDEDVVQVCSNCMEDFFPDMMEEYTEFIENARRIEKDGTF
jgi:hypothetical protein